MRWKPGEVVTWREAWRGQEYIAIPVRVVEDSDEVLAIYVAEGTRFSFPNPWPFAAEHPCERTASGEAATDLSCS
jgi:hypothetical protein